MSLHLPPTFSVRIIQPTNYLALSPPLSPSTTSTTHCLSDTDQYPGSPPILRHIFSVISDSDASSSGDWHDIAEFFQADVQLSRYRYYSDLQQLLPPRETRASDRLYFIPPWPLSQNNLSRPQLENLYTDLDRAHAAARQRLTDAYSTHQRVPLALWTDYFETQQAAEAAFLRLTDIRSIWWPLHRHVTEPHPISPTDTRTYLDARLAWRSLPPAACIWLMNNLPTLAMVISEAQHCPIDLNCYRSQQTTSLPSLISPIPPSPPHSPPSPGNILTLDNHQTENPIPTTEAPNHMYKHFLLENTPVMILVDTGAVASLIRRSALTPQQQEAITNPISPIRLLGASGHRLDIIGQISLLVARDGISVRHQFAVCTDALPTPIILGIDFLRLHVHVLYPDSGRLVMRGSASKSLQPPKSTTAQKAKPKFTPEQPLMAHIPTDTKTVPAGTAIPVFCSIPASHDWSTSSPGDTVLIEPVESLTSHTGLCALPACQLITTHQGQKGVFFLVANPSKTDVTSPGRRAPRAATITKLKQKQLDKSDDYLMQPIYQQWFVAQAGLPADALSSFTELFGRGRIAMDTCISKGNWWINPPWKLIPAAMDKIRTDRPESFFIFGPSAKKTPWVLEARSWGLKELKPPRTLGSQGYFLLRQFDNSTKELPFPQWWDLIAFYGTRADIPALQPTLQSLTASIHTTAAPHDSVHLDEENLSPSELIQARALISDFQDIFQTDDYPVVPDFEMEIDTGNESAVYEKPHRYSPADIAAEDAALKQMLSLNVIEPGFGAWSSRRIQVKKPDGTWRQCVDYRRVNLKTKRDVYPLPRIDSILDALSGAAYISTSDMWKGFWQVAIKESDRPKTAFLTRQGLFQFRVMPFGLRNAPAIYQRLMDNTLAGLLWVTCLCYIDDLICFGPDFSTALSNLREALLRLRARNLRLRADKCYWFFKEVRLLGHVITATSQKPDPAKIQAVTHMTPPTTKEEVASFLGLTGWYQRFIPKFAHIAAPLFDLKKKKAVFIWSSKESTAWQTLKDAMTGPNVYLQQPNSEQPYQLETDASFQAVGGVLQQQDSSGEWRPVLYLSRRLIPAERNYAPTELECLAVLYCVEKCRCYLLGRQFTILTDHKSLEWLLTTNTHEGRLARWALRLQEFDYTIKHRAGTLQVVADALSRLPSSQPPSPPVKRPQHDPAFLSLSVTPKPSDICSLPSCDKPIPPNTSYLFCSYGCRKTNSVHSAYEKLHTSLVLTTHPQPSTSSVLPLPSSDDIIKEQIDAPELQIWWNSIKHKKTPLPGHPQRKLFLAHSSQISIDNSGLLIFRLNADATPLTIVPASLRPTFLHFFHDLPTAGHFGRQKTLTQLQRHCWWPSMPADVDQYVQACICRRTQNKHTPTHRTRLHPIDSSFPNDTISGDVAGPFPTCDGKRYVLVLTCLFSRYTRLFALDSTSAEAAARAFYYGWVLIFGPPKRFLSDRGPQFTAELLRHFSQLLGVSKIYTTPYHPQGDGAAERRFRTLNNSINACWQTNQPWPNILDCIA